ncbi:hypothetical protein DPMN_011993 [Dreissena polymorpha]|uniref:Uncharacterized protein n=1 Tax=Dreissena polymorpha TaxID=45954 RepID=A0A9D4S0W0_DREPO|nr:hypothetical protein DPMN_011993 [Dreissena polymorpha]
MGSKQSHCDALSRLCESPRDCTCSEEETTEPLKCGPCRKCRRLEECMELVWPGKFPDKLRSTLNRETVQSEVPQDLTPVRTVTQVETGTSAQTAPKTQVPPWLCLYSPEHMPNCSYRTQVSASFTLLSVTA